MVILIDGPSGAGKSTLARLLVREWPMPGQEPTLIRMDDVYRGWTGLDEAGEHIASSVLIPRRARERALWQRYDWDAEALAEWHEVDAARPLVIEGSGVLTRASAPLADLRIWLHARDDVRKPRALTRDAGAFDEYWDFWQRQFDAFDDREHPQALVDVTLDSSDWF